MFFGLFKRRGFHPSKREIFRYFNGFKNTSADPLLVQERFLLHPVYRSEVHPKLAEAGDEEAYGICVDAIQKAFGVKDWDPETETGLTRTEQIQLYAAFGSYVDRVKKNIVDLPTLQSSTVATSTPSGETTRSATTDSALTSEGQSGEGPITCEREQTPASNPESMEPVLPSHSSQKPSMTPNSETISTKLPEPNMQLPDH